MAGVTAGPACVVAWSLAEGDVLPGGETVLVVQREPVAGEVVILSDHGSRRWFGRQDRVTVARRAGGDGRPVWRASRFVGGLLPGRDAGTVSPGLAPLRAVLPVHDTGAWERREQFHQPARGRPVG